MSDLIVSEINIYPVKSFAGIALDEVQLDRFGPMGDRRWLVVDDDGKFMSQRDHARMALFKCAPQATGLRLSFNSTHIDVAIPAADAAKRSVQIWADEVIATDAGDAVASWLSTQMDVSCRLVYMADDCIRAVDGDFARAGETVSFADAFPLLLISQASLDDLNGRLESPVPMNRFRPNLVVSGCEAFAEDSWKRIRIGELEFTVAKACARCVMPSIDQQTAERDRSINRVLASFRRRDGKIYFGQNLLYRQAGSLALGATLEVLE